MFLELKGKRALFARHELKIEQYSYNVPTPSAILGILKSIYWKPEMDYVIEKIIVINKPKFELITVNAQSNAQDIVAFGKQINKGKILSVNRKESATPKTMNVLTDVHYIVQFKIVTTGKATCEDDSVAKHTAIFNRRAEKGQCFRQPCMGISEFSCDFNVIDEKDIPESNIKGIQELGVMLHHIDYNYSTPKAVFYKPVMRNGIIDVNETSQSDKGWLFAELCRFYDKNYQKYDLPVLGYSAEKITYKAVLNKNGQMVEFSALDTDEKGKAKPIILTVPEMVKGRTSGVKANFLYDNASYALGLDTKKGIEKKSAFTKKIEDVVKVPNDEISILLKFLNTYDSESYMDLIKPYLKSDGELLGNIVFQIEGNNHFIHESDEIKKQWSTFYENTLPDNMGICAVTGNYEKLADMHPIIKGVINSSSFTKLISVNTSNTAFSSYGWKGLENSSMGLYSTHKYATALNWLLQQKEHRVSKDNSTFVFWSENENEQVFNIIKFILLGLKTEEEYDFSILLEETFYIAELKANASRLYVNGFWQINNIQELVDFSSDRIYKNNITQYWDFIINWKGLENMNKDCVSYKLGELFAILEKAQKDAIKSTRINASISDKYLEKASLMPNIIFSKLLEKSIHHTNKVDYGMKKMITWKISELERFEEPFPSKLPSAERCLFFMGYYQKENELKYKKEKDTDKDE